MAAPKGIANVVKLFSSLISGHSGRVRYSLKASTSGKELVNLGIRFFSKLAATYSRSENSVYFNTIEILNNCPCI